MSKRRINKYSANLDTKGVFKDTMRCKMCHKELNGDRVVLKMCKDGSFICMSCLQKLRAKNKYKNKPT